MVLSKINIKRNSTALLMVALIIFAMIGVLISCFNTNYPEQAVYAAGTNTPTYKLGNAVGYDTDRGNTSSTTISPNTVAYSDMGGLIADITAPIDKNDITITTASNLPFEAAYVDYTASIVVPAMHIYEVTYIVESAFKRNNSGTNVTGNEL